MLGFCSGPGLHLSVSAVSLTLTACCLVRDVNDPVGLAIPVCFANGHDGDVLQPWPSLTWPDQGSTLVAMRRILAHSVQGLPKETRQRFVNLRPRTPSTWASMPPSAARTDRRSRSFRSAPTDTPSIGAASRKAYQRGIGGPLLMSASPCLRFSSLVLWLPDAAARTHI